MKNKFIYCFYLIVVTFFFISNFTIINDLLPNSYPYRFCSDHCNFQSYEVDFKKVTLDSVEQGA